jgi:phosphoglycolate phosphatase-like HAD superfamily hydrolase
MSDTSIVEAVVFDLDGVIIDSEQIWNEVRESLVKERGGRWHGHAQQDMMGMSAPEWSRYMHDVLGLSESPQDISAEVVRRIEGIYLEELPLMKGAVRAVERLASRWPLAVASSSNRQLIDLVLKLPGSRIDLPSPFPPRKCRKGSPLPMSTWRPREGSASMRRTASPLKTRRTASCRQRPPACA